MYGSEVTPIFELDSAIVTGSPIVFVLRGSFCYCRALACTMMRTSSCVDEPFMRAFEHRVVLIRGVDESSAVELCPSYRSCRGCNPTCPGRSGS